MSSPKKPETLLPSNVATDTSSDVSNSEPETPTSFQADDFLQNFSGMRNWDDLKPALQQESKSKTKTHSGDPGQATIATPIEEALDTPPANAPSHLLPSGTDQNLFPAMPAQQHDIDLTDENIAFIAEPEHESSSPASFDTQQSQISEEDMSAFEDRPSFVSPSSINKSDIPEDTPDLPERNTLLPPHEDARYLESPPQNEGNRHEDAENLSSGDIPSNSVGSDPIHSNTPYSDPEFSNPVQEEISINTTDTSEEDHLIYDATAHPVPEQIDINVSAHVDVAEMANTELPQNWQEGNQTLSDPFGHIIPTLSLSSLVARRQWILRLLLLAASILAFYSLIMLVPDLIRKYTKEEEDTYVLSSTTEQRISLPGTQSKGGSPNHPLMPSFLRLTDPMPDYPSLNVPPNPPKLPDLSPQAN